MRILNLASTANQRLHFTLNNKHPIKTPLGLQHSVTTPEISCLVITEISFEILHAKFAVA